MTYEVEQKFPLDDAAKLETKLTDLGARFRPAIEQVDIYFAHPSRDFSVTDEALRIRTVGDDHWITYKGPKLGQVTKTRRELELPLGGGDDRGEQFATLLTCLGFRPVAEVRKNRRPFQLAWQSWQVEGALDHVEELGDFAELELCVESSAIEQAQDAIVGLSSELGLTHFERRSYLELLQEHRAQ
ncbi:MAG: class IV adenylate cyclase [Pirellulales bacterium]